MSGKDITKSQWLRLKILELHHLKHAKNGKNDISQEDYYSEFMDVIINSVQADLDLERRLS